MTSHRTLFLVTTPKPVVRGDCEGGQRPCPWARCRYHVSEGGRYALPDSGESCALDVADRGPQELRAVGDIIGVTRERVRQIEFAALGKLALRGAAELIDGWTIPVGDVLPEAREDYLGPEFAEKVNSAYERIVPERDRRKWGS